MDCATQQIHTRTERRVNDLVRIEDLRVEFRLREGSFSVVNGIDLAIPPNKTLALVGESGCGKSVTARAILRILARTARIVSGRIMFSRADGSAPVDLVSLNPFGNEIRRIRGREISMIFQEPMASLSPVHTIGEQIAEVVRLHEGASNKLARQRALEMMKLVAIPMPARRIDAYPHELSGGLRQRAMIAMALACRPRLLIADEPTTALDVTIQAQILKLLRDLQMELGMAVLMITHDLGVVAQIADEVAVMYMGRIVERAPVATLFATPRHPYTKGLMESVPRIGEGNSARLSSIPGSVPGAFSQIQGCPFHPRCLSMVKGTCDTADVPPLQRIGEAGLVACHLYGSGSLQAEVPAAEARA